ncbi:MAG: insulinase family protein [Clostridia bacterium]|nr:insulinase family protein [Clostridia bacterium]
MPERLNEICYGAEEVFVKTDRFNTSEISFNFYLPLDRERVAEFALLPFILTSCGKNYPDFSRLNFMLSKLYGADLFASSEKIGDYLLLKMGVSTIDDRFALDKESISSMSVDMLVDLIFNPKAENGSFCVEDLAREKRRAIESIKSEISEKRIYAATRLIEEMFDDDIYSVKKCGTIKQVEAITGESLYSAWEYMLTHAFLRINVVASKEPAGILNVVKENLEKFERKSVTDCSKTTSARRRALVKRVEEKMDVAQGKLVMGFNVTSNQGEDNTVLSVMANLFGGGPYSLLFTNVREKMSLCYYCAASLVKEKGFMTVSSGIEPKNAEKAEKEILNQLSKIGDGDFDDDTFKAVIRGICDSLKTLNDSQSALDTWYANRIFIRQNYSPDEVADKIQSVTREEVSRAARNVALNTVYMLMPKGEK